MGRIPKPDHQAPAPVYPTPAPADYSDEVTEEVHEALTKLVQEDEDEELELVDGPAW